MTKPYSETEFLADPGFDKYDADPKPKHRLRIVPQQNSMNILSGGDTKEGMSTLYPMPTEEDANMDASTTLYIGSLSIVGLYILFRVLYR